MEIDTTTIAIKNNYCCQRDDYTFYQIPAEQITPQMRKILKKYTKSRRDIYSRPDTKKQQDEHTILLEILDKRIREFNSQGDDEDEYKKQQYRLYNQVC